MPTIGFEAHVTACTTFSRRMTWRGLLVLFVGTLPLPFAAISAQADPSKAAPHGQAVVINENPSNAMGERHPGSVSWRIDRAKTAGRPDELVIHADIEIPDMKMTAMLDIRRNTDKSLPASHVMEMKFALPHDVAGGKVISAPGVMMKFTERARGTPLSALTVKVTESSFLAGLSNVDVDRAQYPTPERTGVVRHSHGLRQSAPRHTGGREGVSWRGRIQRSHDSVEASQVRRADGIGPGGAEHRTGSQKSPKIKAFRQCWRP